MKWNVLLFRKELKEFKYSETRTDFLDFEEDIGNSIFNSPFLKDTILAFFVFTIQILSRVLYFK